MGVTFATKHCSIGRESFVAIGMISAIEWHQNGGNDGDVEERHDRSARANESVLILCKASFPDENDSESMNYEQESNSDEHQEHPHGIPASRIKCCNTTDVQELDVKDENPEGIEEVCHWS
jgi:hypothetical protein